MIPQSNSPKIIFQLVSPMVTIKTTDSVRVTKNSEKFTEPMVLRGECPVEISVEVTTAPSRHLNGV